MPAVTYDQLVAELQALGLDLGGPDRRVAAHLARYEGHTLRTILRWVGAAAGRARS